MSCMVCILADYDVRKQQAADNVRVVVLQLVTLKQVLRLFIRTLGPTAWLSIATWGSCSC